MLQTSLKYCKKLETKGKVCLGNSAYNFSIEIQRKSAWTWGSFVTGLNCYVGMGLTFPNPFLQMSKQSSKLPDICLTVFLSHVMCNLRTLCT